ncbi:hypothetical protein GGU10DRAFT_345024 [Lentinula aff. detonsa]|uniref:Uncharacterized protein n=1 Tax=Lentinula aff. detonsa TaxID=2804958 RepID=A0AA38L671_9AGAR|nr:hypothetical protein GGU10DRAFT_345024 [Lentinula aff. detonsa]
MPQRQKDAFILIVVCTGALGFSAFCSSRSCYCSSGIVSWKNDLGTCTSATFVATYSMNELMKDEGRQLLIPDR